MEPSSYLFWPIFLEKAKQEVIEGHAPKRYYEIRLAWSEYREGKWSPKRVTNEYFVTDAGTKLETLEQFSFWAQVDDENRLYILFDRRKYRKKPTNDLIFQQFRFADCNGSLEVTSHGVKACHSANGTRLRPCRTRFLPGSPRRTDLSMAAQISRV